MNGKQNIDLPAGYHRIKVETVFPLLLSIDGNPVAACPAGTYEKVFRTQSDASLSVDPTEAKKEYGLSIRSKASTPGETVDDLPPPEPPAPDNYLQALRYKVRQQMGITREAFAERPSPYEIGELPPLFEEEEKAIAKKRAEKAKAKAEEEAKAKDQMSETVQAEPTPDQKTPQADEAQTAPGQSPV